MVPCTAVTLSTYAGAALSTATGELVNGFPSLSCCSFRAEFFLLVVDFDVPGLTFLLVDAAELVTLRHGPRSFGLLF